MSSSLWHLTPACQDAGVCGWFRLRKFQWPPILRGQGEAGSPRKIRDGVRPPLEAERCLQAPCPVLI